MCDTLICDLDVISKIKLRKMVSHPQVFSSTLLEIDRGIKKVFIPSGIKHVQWGSSL